MPRASDKNRCLADKIAEIQPAAVTRPRRGLHPEPPSPPVNQVRPAVPAREEEAEDDSEESRILTMEAKKDIFRRYFE